MPGQDALLKWLRPPLPSVSSHGGCKLEKNLAWEGHALQPTGGKPGTPAAEPVRKRAVKAPAGVPLGNSAE